MIYVEKGAPPASLERNKSGWLGELRQARREKNTVNFNKVQNKYKSNAVKKGLVSAFSGKCAYCESVVGVVGFGHIEHFRPKCRYLSLTYEWSNLLLSCERCNSGAHKGTLFPGVLSGGPIINPCVDDPGQHLEFLYDSKLSLAYVRALTSRGGLSVEIFGLNSRPELMKARSSLIKKLLLLRVYASTDPKAAALLDEAKSSGEPYLAWVRKLL